MKYKNQPIEEDTPEGVKKADKYLILIKIFRFFFLFKLEFKKYKRSLWSVTCKLFADIERLRVREEANKVEERKRKAEETTEREERIKMRKEWDKNYEVRFE